MERKIQGNYITVSTVGEPVRSFVPFPLPPDPPLNWTPELRDKFDRALLALGRLDSVSTLLPDTSLFLYMYVRKEAVLSSQIEGTRSSLSDLLLYELEQEPGVPVDDAREVSNYVAALEHGLARLEEGFPLSLRLIKEIHGVLLARDRGHDRVMECMGELESFLHDKTGKTSTLIKAGLAHVQFETIHPFLDGNGRLGRLLIALLLCSEEVLHAPMLYLSLYFKTHRQYYYELLNHVRLTGDWESWLDFFAEAVIESAGQAVETARSLVNLAETDRRRINDLGRVAGSIMRIHQALLERPIVSSTWLTTKTGLSPATVNNGLQRLERLGVVKEISGRQRNRLYVYSQYIEIMNQGTEPLAAGS